MKKKPFPKDEGISLVELFVVLSITGVLLLGALRWMLYYRKKSSLEKTRQNQELVISALETFFRYQKYLPAPAAYEKNSETRGRSSYPWRSDNVMGIIPYQTLGLPEDVAKDGYGRWMTYMVDPGWCVYGHGSKATWCRQMLGAANYGVLDVKEKDRWVRQGLLAPALALRKTWVAQVPSQNQAGENFHNSKESRDFVSESFSSSSGKDFQNFQNGIAFILISHGQHGAGALSNRYHQDRDKEGARNPAPCKEINIRKRLEQDRYCACAAANGDEELHFDHRVVWKTRYEMMAQFPKFCQDSLEEEGVADPDLLFKKDEPARAEPLLKDQKEEWRKESLGAPKSAASSHLKFPFPLKKN